MPLGIARALCHHARMTLADGIRRHGFRKWYERELMRSHAFLALTILCTVGVLAALESAGPLRADRDQLFDVLSLLLCAGVGLWALRRYLYLLSHAEATAHQADCPGCGTYARFQLVSADRAGELVTVCCRQCERRWEITS